MAEKKEKQYVSDNARLMAEWDWDKNNEVGLYAQKLTLSSGKKAHWKCLKGHKWQAVIANRTKGSDCPYCSGRCAVKGVNDLATLHPGLTKEWNYEKNRDFKPEDFTVNSGKKVWWKCSKEHEWEAAIYSRNSGTGCPICSNKQILIGYNDFATVNPTLASEWNHQKNGKLKPENFTANSNKKVWWKCRKGHEWQADINNRNNGTGCPYCSGNKVLKGYNDLVTINPLLSKEWDYERNINLSPQNFTANSSVRVWWKCSNGHEWQATICGRSRGLGCPICSGHKVLIGYNDLLTLNPQLSKEWNYEKNGDLKPEGLTVGSGKKVWWKCSKGHEWQATICNRNNGQGCPICASKKVLKGFNDLSTLNPKLEKQWNYKKNGKLKPENFTANSNKKVWWICEKGHEWQARVQRINNGGGCPYCLGRYAIIGQTDFKTINPHLANEWNYEKNGDLRPEMFTANGTLKVWWKCSKGHEWQATLHNRNNGGNCPVCSSERNTSFPEYAIAFYAQRYGLDIIHSYKEKGYELDIYIPLKKVAIEYDGYFYHKDKIKKDLEKNTKCQNDGIKLYRIREGLPSLNDSSTDFIADKHQKKLGVIIGEILSEIVGFSIDVDLERDNIEIENLREYIEKTNSLLFTNSELAKEWNYERNGNLKPEYILPNSVKKVWWKCCKEHEWQATINSRNQGGGCPYCSGRFVSKGENDLATRNPTLAKEWNYEKNGLLKPEDFTAGSNKKVWWKCKNGHDWYARISSRNNGNGCPECAKQKRMKNKNKTN